MCTYITIYTHMDKDSIKTIKLILNKCNVHFEDFNQLDGLLIPREVLLLDHVYNNVQKDIHSLKSIFSSSYMTSLQKSASKQQKWPLLNLVRQTLKNINYKMVPIRKSDGYTKDGTKKFKRFFQVKKLKWVKDFESSTIIIENDESEQVNDKETVNI